MKLTFNVKSIFLLFMMLIPALVFSQNKNVISAHRIFHKMDKTQEFEKALAAHAQKYHSGDVTWRVFAIESGPDAGGFHITEGPNSWDGLDGRGDLSTEHKNDWDKNVAIYLTDRQSSGFSVYIDSLSTMGLGEFTDKIQISHIYPKVAQGDNVVNIIRKLKKAWTVAGMNVVVYSASASGPAQYTLVTRYKQGLKERAAGFRKPFKQAYEEANGEGSYAQYLKDVAEYVNESWSELLFLRKDLSSK